MQSATASDMLQWQLSEKGFVSVSGGVNDGLSEFYSLGALRLFGIGSTPTNAPSTEMAGVMMLSP